MRTILSFVALASLVACNQQQPSEEAGDVPVAAAALTYDGANAAGPAAVRAHGERLSRVLGCQGCHGEDYAGTNVTDGDEAFGDIYAANLSILLAEYSDEELDRAIRQGVPKDGREMIFMPSEMYNSLSDADLAAIIAHLRTVQPTGSKAPPHKPGPAFRAMVESGEYSHAADMVGKWKEKGPAELGEVHAFGRYIARTACTECHDIDLTGFENFSPDLNIASAYSADELNTLLTTGKGKSKPDLGLMKIVAQNRFSHLTQRERDSLIAYLKARADRPQ